MLDRLAQDLVDGRAIDWAAAERSATVTVDVDAIRHLRVLAEIAELHGPANGVADATPVEAPAADTWLGFELLEHVGEGSYGELYRAHDQKLHREVALKLIKRHSRGAQDEVLHEGRLMARLRHPNVVTVYGADAADGRVGIWMEFIKGRTLASLVKERGSYSADETTAIGVDLSRALAAVHKAGLLHRDIKAANVMREEGGRIVLMDFGAGGAFDPANASISGSVAGTPLYLAPEQFAGQPATLRSDIYSLGVLLFHLASGGFRSPAAACRTFATRIAKANACSYVTCGPISLKRSSRSSNAPAQSIRACGMTPPELSNRRC